jgi:Uma2 family endonuclease
LQSACAANADAFLELEARGHLVVMTPTGGQRRARNVTLLVWLEMALRSSVLAFKLFDSSTGFLLSDGFALRPNQRRALRSQ